MSTAIRARRSPYRAIIDPTGNAAANAELSKNRAQSVKAALEKLGFAADKVVLEKPAETTTTGTDNAAARRVEVTVKG